MKTKGLAISLVVTYFCLGFISVSSAQTPTPSPGSSGNMIGGYEVTSSVEFGVRGLDVNGNHEKYRSDLNYEPGFRIFDSSFLLEDRTNNRFRAFDTALVMMTGFGADPSGSFRFNADRVGIYKFDSNIRRVKYFNYLNNHAAPEPIIGGRPRGQHNFNTEHDFGDFDLTIFPESQKLRFRLGYSYNDTEGPGTSTTRFQGDEFEVRTNVQTESKDFRAGIDGQVLGFNLGLTYGYRRFNDNTRYFEGASLGNNLAGTTARIDFFGRTYPINGSTNFVHFNSQRTFAKKLDFTGRFIYSFSDTDFNFTDLYVGRGSTSATPGTPFFIDLNQVDVSGDVKRPQSRGDIGLTYRITENLRISDTFTFDQFNISGGNLFSDALITRTAAGAPRPFSLTTRLFQRITNYRRFSNLIDLDYQVNNRFGFNVGWRYTDRTVGLYKLNFNRGTGLPENNTPDFDDHENTTHSFLASVTAKPLNNWSIFGEMEIGDSDNVFTRVANNEFKNFLVRTRASFNTFSLNASAIWKDNDSPVRAGATNTTTGAVIVPEFVSIVESQSRVFSASVDWTLHDDWTFSGGYTYQHLTSRADVLVPISGVYRRGLSEYYVRDSYLFFDITARPIKRVSVFASYRISDDDGQGDRVAARPEDIISSYPIKFQSPEIRLAIRLTRNIDWNVGYQYYDYKERQTQTPFIGFNQNYNAHLPYTSLRIYFGKAAVDR